MEVSFNNGATWEQAQKNPQDNDEYHFSSYWTPIPQGTTAVKFRADDYGINNEAWQVRDITIWSKEAPPAVLTEYERNILFKSPDELFTEPSETNFCYIPEE
jgi:hypothetical protein